MTTFKRQPPHHRPEGGHDELDRTVVDRGEGPSSRPAGGPPKPVTDGGLVDDRAGVASGPGGEGGSKPAKPTPTPQQGRSRALSGSNTPQRVRRSAGVVLGRSLISPADPHARPSFSQANVATAGDMSAPRNIPSPTNEDADVEAASNSGFTRVGSYTAKEHDLRDSSNRLANLALEDDHEDDATDTSASAFSLRIPEAERRQSEAPPKESSPSGLSRLLQKHGALDRRKDAENGVSEGTPSPTTSEEDDGPTPVVRSPMQPTSKVFKQPEPPEVVVDEAEPVFDESAKGTERERLLLPSGIQGYGSGPDPAQTSHVAPTEPHKSRRSPLRTLSLTLQKRALRYRTSASESVSDARTYLVHLAHSPKEARRLALEPVYAVPPVILGILMNILDAVSYGLISFPTNLPVFAPFGGIGVSMFFVSAVIAQLVYTLGGSAFKGGNASMMIECVPFLHVIAQTIVTEVGDDKDKVIATTMVAYALSSVLTGLVFFALGWMKMGGLMGFFPRHILVGAIGAVGLFLVLTGLEVTARLEDNFDLSLETLRLFFTVPVVALWTIPLALAIILRLITARFSHPFIVPGFFLSVPIVFYIIVFALRVPLDSLRQTGWIFEIEGVSTGPWEFYELFDFTKIDWEAIATTIPTQLALVAFGLIHVPINLPSLALSLGQDDLDLDRELVAHGYSNTIAGLLGTVPNYLCYVNSVLFVRVGGDSRVASFMLACATFGIFLLGPWVIGYLPVCVVGALIFLLGIDLVKEAVWDTFGRVNRFEYLTIWAIIIASTWSDFVIGLLVGIILACVSFVVTSSQRRAIRTIISGSTARSTVRRHPKQTAFLKKIGSQTRILKMQGHLFFGTISAAEKTIKEILDAAAWNQAPIRFLIFDFNAAVGMDFSAAEAFLRIQRLLTAKGVVFVISGADPDGVVGKALRSVDLWAGNEDLRVEVFEHLNEALEHCENSYLRSLYSHDLQPVIKSSAAGIELPRPDDELPTLNGRSLALSLSSSPRRNLLRDAAHETLAVPQLPENKGLSNLEQPIPLLTQSFRPFLPDRNFDFWHRVAPYFTCVKLQKGEVLWKVGADADSFYLIEKGILCASYSWPPPIASTGGGASDGTSSPRHRVQESMLPGTVAGDHTFLASIARNTEVVAERDVTLWRMDTDGWERLVKEQGPEVRGVVAKGLLRMSSEEQEVITSYFVTNAV